MKKIIKIIILLFAISILLSHTSIAPHEPDHLEALEEQELVTYEAFLKKPTLEGFEQLSESNKAAYVSTLTSFAGENQKIAAMYFLQVNNVNTQRKPFEKYVATKGISLILEGNILDLGADFFLQTKSPKGNAQISLQEWKGAYSFQVKPDGTLVLISKSTQAAHAVTGTMGSIDTNEGKFLSIAQGTIDGKEVIEGIISLQDKQIRGAAFSFNDCVFYKNEKGEGGHFVYDAKDNTLTILNPENKDELFFMNPGKGMTIVSKSNAVIYFLETGDMFRKSAMTYNSQGKIEKIQTTDNNVLSFVNGLIYNIPKQGDAVNICYKKACADEFTKLGKNYVYQTDKSLFAGGNGFEVILNKFYLSQYKEKSTLSSNPKKLDAESLFFGFAAKGTADYYDHISFSFTPPSTADASKLQPWNGGSIVLEKAGNEYRTTAKGQVFIQNGYWEIYSDGNNVQKGTTFNPQKTTTKSGRDAIPMKITFLMDDGTTKEGFSFIDKKGAPDLFQVPASYLGSNPKAGTSLTPEEFRENFIAQLELLKGQPLDFSEGTSSQEIQCTNEFVCVDVVSSAYYLATGRDILADKAAMGFGSATARRNSELYGYFKAKDAWFETQEFDGKDFLGSDEKLRGSWNTGIVVDPAKVVFPSGGTFTVDWEGRYGLEKDKVQFMMFQKQHVKQEADGRYIKEEGSPMYHIVPVFWDDTAKEYMTIQAPGECRLKGVCQIPLTEYTNNNRCSSLDELKTGCYAYYGVTQVIKAKTP